MIGKEEKAREHYHQAIKLAQESGYSQEEGLIYECFARFWLDQREEEVAQLYMQKARYRYQHWGAQALVRDLEAKFPSLLRESPVESDLASKTPVTITSSSTDTTVLDYTSVMNASQTISGEIVLEKMPKKNLPMPATCRCL